MKNLTYIPFIRNRYFQGKLLTAEDFLQEQQYMNDKRRLMNRWTVGAGIVAGLEVIKVDDYSISLEMGLALDYTGREIMVDTPVIRKLSALEGYREATMEEGNESLYLCIGYEEESMEPVHNITNRAVHTVEEPEYNKVRECYRLYVTDDEPGEAGEQDESGTWDEEERIIRDRAEQIHRREYEPGIHLARIYLVKAGDFYMIDRIEPVPFRQYVYSQELLGGWIRTIGRRLEEQDKLIGELKKNRSQKTEDSTGHSGDSPWQLAQGMAAVAMPDGGREGHCYYSREIAHGLGLGNVQIHLEVIADDYSFSGAEDIFGQQEKPVEAASRLSRSGGTFVIGVRALDNIKRTEIQVAWTAVRRRTGNEFQRGEARIFIKPSLVNLKLHQDIKLEAVCVNMSHETLEWCVAEQEGGMIDADGTYHAPGRPGVYEVTCRSGTGTAASVFIIVRE